MRILYLCDVLPWPYARTGNAQRTGHLLRALRRLGDVEAVLVSPSAYLERPEVVEALRAEASGIAGALTLAPEDLRTRRSLFLRGLPGPAGHLACFLDDVLSHYRTSPAIRDGVRALGAYDLTVTRYAQTACQAGLLTSRQGPPTYVDMDDLDWAKLALEFEEAWPNARLRLRLAQGVAVRRVRKVCVRRLRNARRCWLSNEHDIPATGLGNVGWLPNVPVAVTTTDPSPSEGESVLFVGDLSYAPNVTGLDHFLAEVWPRLVARVPGAELRIVGADLRAEEKERWSRHPAVRVLGFVEDLGEAYRECAFTIAPLTWGGGTKIKVLESLAHGRTVVLTPHALHGLDRHLRPGHEVRIGSTDPEFSDACADLLARPEERRALERAGRDVIRSEYSEAAFDRIVEDTIGNHAP